MLISFTLDKDGFRVSKPLDARFVTNVTYIKAHFDVSEPTWNDAKVLVAVFKSATYNESCRMILDENNNCFVEPKVFMRGGTIQVKLCGDAYDSDWVRCTTHLTDTVEFFVRPESLLTAEPPSKYAVFLAEIERLREEYAGSGGNYESQRLSLVQPNEDGYLFPHNVLITGHHEFSIDPTVSTRGTLEVGLSQKPSNLAAAVVFQGVQSQYNGLPFDKVIRIYYDYENRTYKIELQSDTPMSLNANDISIEAVEFLYGAAHEYNACVLAGTCDEGGGSAT